MNAGTSLYVGPGVRVEGRICQEGVSETIVIAGAFAGDIVTQGRLVVEAQGKIDAANEIKCFELDVAGTIEGRDVLVEAGIFRLGPSSRVSVGEISLPPGGLEQSRGAVLCAKLRMEDGNAFAADDRLKVLAPKTVGAANSQPPSASILSSIEVKPPAAAASPAASVALAPAVPPSIAAAASPVSSLAVGSSAFLANAAKAEPASSVKSFGSPSSRTEASSFEDADAGIARVGRS